MTNEYHNKSVDRIGSVAEEHYFSSDDDPATIVRDILADLRHYCDAHKLCLGELDAVAHKYYLDELG